VERFDMIVAGFGFSTKASLESLRSALDAACGDRRPRMLATLNDKLPLLRELGASIGLEVRGVSEDDAARQETITRSPASLGAHGVASVAEAVALAAAGPGAKLLGSRAISQDRLATCALAQGSST
jgi:cobalt-precorrin 5A hydrolase